MMASTAAFRDDIAGAITTGGTSTAYTVASYQVFDSLSHMNGQMIAFTPHATNGATVTLNVDGLGAKPLRSAPSVELPAGVLILGSPYVALYNSSDAVWYLQNFYINPYSIPIAGTIDYWASTAPNSSFALTYGQAISRSTYSVLFGLVGTTYGVGDGSTTFNLPDCRGRVIAGNDDMGGGTTAGRLTDASMSPHAYTLGGVGGAETKTLVTANLPAYTPTGTVATTTISTINAAQQPQFPDQGGGKVAMGGASSGGSFQATSFSSTSTFTGVAQGGLSTPFNTVQPTIIANKIIRII
jgi:microcystin-dependent protein